MPNKSLHCTTNHDPPPIMRPPRHHPSESDDQQQRKEGCQSQMETSPPSLGMSPASRYKHNLKVLRRRDPSIISIFDQFSHVCVYHHDGKKWEKHGYEGSMFLFERCVCVPLVFFFFSVCFSFSWLWLMKTQKGRLPAIWILRPQSHGHGRLYPTHLPRRRYLRTW